MKESATLGAPLWAVRAPAVAFGGAVGELAPALRQAAAGQSAEFGDLVEAPLAALADQRLGQHR